MWWIKYTILSLGAVFFLFFGIIILISAYDLDDPFLFLGCFFSSNLIILISAALLFGFISRMIMHGKDELDDEKE